MKKTLWTGGPGSRGYDFGIPGRSMAHAVAAVAEQIDRQTQLKPEAVAAQLGRKAVGYGDYQSFGDLMLELPGSSETAQDYRRELDLRRAFARVRYTRGGVHFLREYFASCPDGVIVARLSADQPGQISFTCALRCA